MTYTIHPLTLEDIPETFTMAQQAFSKSNRHFYNPYPYSDESHAQLLERQLDFFKDRPPNQAFKAVDDATGHIVGAAGWGVHVEDEPVTQTLKETVEARMQPRIPELCEDPFRGVYTAMNEGRREVIGVVGGEGGEVVRFKKRVELQFLHTHPEYQRRGIGSALLKRFLEETAGLGLMLYLQATDEGRPLYEKIGFEAVLKRTYVFEDGDAEPYNISFMVKSPKVKTLCVSGEGLHSPETAIA
ncbi:acyl-CoA N-acyltransferase [Aspergillus campestris IBT 28561]|uniref:Acyl-CoA N-acyltransferase n=1 Tax=Aspergillus campestris (strain IBT 28561) TaxID=1392248 RepID=A0A2I1CQI0_ASPC2|nr:acyl-CoA N-acyltransferase [Aspergillus campestris IBT 28561]PKX99868.1 acyl-CoA N-acyltransferase [Aspergillus campestris IBT 28561]